jgi:hypothetical protein
MIRIAMMAVLVAIVATGCTRYRVFYGENDCLRQVVINYASGKTVVAPKRGGVCTGTTIRMITVPQNRAVSTVPKPGNPSWLMGGSAGPDFVLMVPENETIGAVREYSVEVDGLPTLDPTFRVIR